MSEEYDITAESCDMLKNGNSCEEGRGTADEAVLSRKKKGSLADTAAMQAILCLLMAVGFLAANIARPDLAADIFSVYTDKIADSDGFTDIIRAVADFLRSTPNV